MVAMFGRYSRAMLFLDPPYPVASRGTHETMYAVEMNADEHEQLARQLRRVPARVLLTISPDTVYSDILADWHVTPYAVRGMRNQVKTELALTNYPPPTSLLHWAPLPPSLDQSAGADPTAVPTSAPANLIDA